MGACKDCRFAKFNRTASGKPKAQTGQCLFDVAAAFAEFRSRMPHSVRVIGTKPQPINPEDTRECGAFEQREFSEGVDHARA